MELGFKGKIRQLHQEMELKRSQGEDVTLRQYLEEKYDGTKPEQLYSDLEINLHEMTIENLLNMDDDTRWIVPEIFRDAIRKGMVSGPWYKKITATEENISQPTLSMPCLDVSDAEMKETDEGETIATGSVSYSQKDVKIKKIAKGLKISYEAIQYCKVKLLSVFLQDIGRKLGAGLNRQAVMVLTNGDQADGSEAPATIGVTSPSDGLTYQDIVRLWVRMSMIDRYSTSMIGTESMINRVLNMEQFLKPFSGNPQKKLNLETPVPSEQDVFIHNSVGPGKICFLDKSTALVRLTAAPLTVESEKIISKQIQQSFASITTGFANIHRDARIYIDSTKEFSSNGFPAWVTPDNE